jgi:hypothetical protein
MLENNPSEAEKEEFVLFPAWYVYGRPCDENNGFWLRWLDLLVLHLQSLLITINAALSQINTIYSSPLSMH